MTTRTRRIKATTTTTPVEDVTVEQTTEELRKQIVNADQAMSGLSLRMEDLQEQIDVLTTTEEDIAQEQETRTSHIHALQEEIGRLGLELQDLTFDTTIKGDAATAGSVQRRVDLQSSVKGDLQTAQKEHAKLLREETERLPQLAEDKKLLEKQLSELETQRNTFATKQAAISADLGEAIYREGSAKLDELARAKRGASLDQMHHQEEEVRTRAQLKQELAPWYSLRQQAIRELNLDQKPADGLTRIVMGLISLLDTIEQDGSSVPMLVDGKPTSQVLSPLSGDVLRTLVGPNVLNDLDRRNYFNQRREQLSKLLETHNRNRR